jgi:hypothetical protein
MQAYSTTATYTWNTSGSTGTVYFSVWARDASSNGTVASSLGAYDTNKTVTYTVNAPRCGAVTISPSPASPRSAGTQVAFTAAATSCNNPNPLYEFWRRPSTSSTWTLVQAHSTNNTYSWNTSGAAGTYYVSVWAKDAASTTGTYDANATSAYVVNAARCGSVSMTASPASPSAYASGAQVTFTATASGCTNASPLYEFWIRPANSTTWTVVQAYSISNTYDFDSTSRAAGTYYVSVWLKDGASTTTTFDANATVGVGVT